MERMGVIDGHVIAFNVQNRERDEAAKALQPDGQ